MKILFHITGYKNFHQFRWLLNAIYNPDDLFLVHIDKKSSEKIHHGFQQIAFGYNNIIFIPSICVTWGGTGLIDAETSAIKFALDNDIDWKYLINLTAQDYPLTPLSDIRHTLCSSWPTNFVLCTPLTSTHWRIRKRCWFRHVEFRDRRYITPIPRIAPYDLHIRWRGPWWHVLTRDFCIWWQTDAKAKRYDRFLRHAGMPDELLIQNLIMDSPFKSTVTSECKHELIWRHAHDRRSASSHPNVLRTSDLPLLESSRAFFARKFDPAIDRVVLEKLAQRIQALTPK